MYQCTLFSCVLSCTSVLFLFLLRRVRIGTNMHPSEGRNDTRFDMMSTEIVWEWEEELQPFFYFSFTELKPSSFHRAQEGSGFSFLPFNEKSSPQISSFFLIIPWLSFFVSFIFLQAIRGWIKGISQSSNHSSSIISSIDAQHRKQIISCWRIE